MLLNAFLVSEIKKSVLRSLLVKSDFLDFVKSSFFNLVDFQMILAFDRFLIFLLTLIVLLIVLPTLPLPCLSLAFLSSALQGLLLVGVIVFNIEISGAAILLNLLINQ